MGSWVYRPDHPEANENGMVPKAIAGERVVKLGTSANVISDTLSGVGINGLRHMGTGKMLDSKSAFRATDKAIGATCVGNDKSYVDPKPREFIDVGNRGRDIKRAIDQLRGNR